MAHRLACETDRFAAIAVVSGNLSTSVARSCSNGKPVSVLALQGTDDPLVPYGVELTHSVAHWLAHPGRAKRGTTCFDDSECASGSAPRGTPRRQNVPSSRRSAGIPGAA
jgi:hypothetical protein